MKIFVNENNPIKFRKMSLDFTLSKYRTLCESFIKSDYTTITVEDYILGNKDPIFVILRHDVDRKPEMALDMAMMEHEMGLKATYYFRMIPEVFDTGIIKTIRNMGHEIGFHYEVLDKEKGDKEKAIALFEKELNIFREVADVKTICMHGNPLAKWSNKDLWDDYDFRDFGLLGEPYLSIDYDKVMYLSDTGRGWNSIYSIKDLVKTSFNEAIKSTDNLIELIGKKKLQTICILVHPNRWTDNMSVWIIELLFQNVKNIGKFFIKNASR